jgi:hypothetical protein
MQQRDRITYLFFSYGGKADQDFGRPWYLCGSEISDWNAFM